jgi:hypothetical protein
MSAPVGPRPHRRAVQQLLLGLLPVLVLGTAMLVVLSVRLVDARAPLTAATSFARATVVSTGHAPDGRGVTVTLDGSDGPRRGVLVLADPADAAGIPRGTELGVAFDPDDPPGRTAVFLPGDAAHQREQNLLFGLAIVAAVMVVLSLITGLRVLTRRRLRRGAPVAVTASRVVIRRGLLVRSWLELVTSGGVRWLPVYWSPELAQLAPGTPIEVRGDPVRGRLVLPVVGGAELWPSGRLRTPPPRGEREVAAPMPETESVGWARQLRVDAVPVAVAPVLGLLWSYVDGSGLGGFLVATGLLASVLFWLPETFGSDPAPPPRD